MPQAQTITTSSTRSKSGADLIVFDARIFTGNLAPPESSAFAVRNRRIYSVGTDAEILERKSSSTQGIDPGAHVAAAPDVPHLTATTIGLWWHRHHSRQRLANMDVRMLRDIGVSRADARQEARKWFWQS